MTPTDDEIDTLRRAAFDQARAALADPAASWGWWYLSFADPLLPKGTQFLGAALVDAPDHVSAMVRAHELGINPGGDVAAWGPFNEKDMPGAEWRLRLLSREEAETL